MATDTKNFEPHIGRSISLDHAAELLGVSRRTIYNRIRQNRLQTIRTAGGSQRVLIDSIGAMDGEPDPTAKTQREQRDANRRFL